MFGCYKMLDIFKYVSEERKSKIGVGDGNKI